MPQLLGGPQRGSSTTWGARVQVGTTSQAHGHAGHRCKGGSEAGEDQSLVRLTGEGLEGPGSRSAQLMFLTEVLCTAGRITG